MRIPRIKSLSTDEQAPHHSGAAAHDNGQTDPEHTLLAVSLRIWGATLFILAVPVLGIATFNTATSGKAPLPATAELCAGRGTQAPVTRFVAQDRLPGTD